jgi:hypothetical protein
MINHWGMDQLKHYEEMSTPLPFIVFGLWGKLVGHQLWAMRLSAILIAVATLYQLGICCRHCVKTRKEGWLLAIGLCLGNPYFLPMGTMCYTDMLAMFFLLLAFHSMWRRDTIGLAIGTAGMLWCRQYLVFAVMSIGLIELLRFAFDPSARRLATKMITAVVVGIIPFVWLIWLWGSLAPQNKTQFYYLSDHRQYNPTSLVLYVSLIFWFSIPVLLVKIKLNTLDKSSWGMGLLCSVMFAWFPVKPSEVAVDGLYMTTGLTHRIFNFIEPNGILASILFYIGFLAGLSLLIDVVRKTWQKGRSLLTDDPFYLLPILTLILFLAVMPWSYLHWEKYFLPAIPMCLIMLINHSRKPTATATNQSQC